MANQSKPQRLKGIYTVLMICAVYAVALNILSAVLSGYFNWSSFLLCTVVGYIVGDCLGIFLPLTQWGMASAKAVGFSFQKPKTFRVGVGIFYTLYFVLLESFIMVLFSMCLLGGSPIGAALMAWLQDFIPNYLVALVITLTLLGTFERIAGKLAKCEESW